MTGTFGNIKKLWEKNKFFLRPSSINVQAGQAQELLQYIPGEIVAG